MRFPRVPFVLLKFAWESIPSCIVSPKSSSGSDLISNQGQNMLSGRCPIEMGMVFREQPLSQLTSEQCFQHVEPFLQTLVLFGIVSTFPGTSNSSPFTGFRDEFRKTPQHIVACIYSFNMTVFFMKTFFSDFGLEK